MKETMYRFVIQLVLFAMFSASSALAGPILPNASAVSGGQQIGEVKQAAQSLAKGKLEEALTYLTSAKENNPQLPPAKFMLARLLILQGKVDSGRSYLEEVAVAEPGHPEIYVQFGELALSEQRLTDAKVHFDRAATLSPPAAWSSDQHEKLKLACHSGRARVAELRRDWSSATKELRRALTINEKDLQIRNRLAVVLFRQGDTEEAYRELKIIADANPSFGSADTAFAKMLASSGEAEKAIRLLTDYTKAHPGEPGPQAVLASIHFEQGDSKAAAGHAKKAYELGQADRDTCMLNGLVARSLGDLEGAERWFGELYEKSPADFEVCNQLALVLADQEDSKKKQKALQLAVMNARQFPKNSIALSTLGWVYFRNGKAREAERYLRAAASAGKGRSETAYFLSRVLTANGETEAADQVTTLLRSVIDRPGVFVLRDEAKRWLADTASVQ